jgi:tetratricopeptide (TPR) repeat protein
MEQMPLFEDEFMLLNDASSALRALRPDDALALLDKHRALYPGSHDADRNARIAIFLKQGLSGTPPAGPARPSYLFRLWDSFEQFCQSLGPGIAAADEFLNPIFHKIVDAIDEGGIADTDFLAEGIPVGYAHLQIGEYDRAIRSLQASLAAAPDNAAIYGYLGDAYFLRGDRATARHLYFEACLIEPAAVDWTHLRDSELKDLFERIPDEYGFDSELACQWFPVCAYVRGLFAPKLIRLRDEFKAFTGRHMALKKHALRTPSPSLPAKLFLQGIVLCDNEPFLTLFKGIDFADVRREMKEANAEIFAQYLKQIDRRTKNGR